MKSSIAVISVCCLAACTPLKKPTEPAKQPMQRSVSAAQMTSWTLNGAMGAQTQKKSWTAAVNWMQQGENNYQIRLSGPIGSGTVLLERHGNTVVYRDGPKTITGHNADAVIFKQTGMHFPASNLYYWVRGLPAPGSVSAVKHNGAMLTQFSQAGYLVDYNAYQTVNGMQLPEKIQLSGHGVKIKFAIRHWQPRG